MSKKFSELPPKDSLDSADYIPIVDSADSDPETQNKIVTFQTVRGYFTEDLDEFLATAQAHESARVSAENTRRSNETTRQSREDTRESNEATRQSNEATRQANEATREDAETGYIQQAKSWAVGTNGVARAGDATDNAKYYAEQASASATSASASATSASASATMAGTAKDSAQASATQAAISAESVDAPALTKKILAAFPQESLSGSLLTLSDGADGIPVKTLTLNLTPHQSGSGDPSPDNVRPISGYDAVTVTRTGKNVMPFMPISGTSSGVTIASDAEKQIYTVSGMSTGYRGFLAADTFTIKAGTYKLSQKASSDSVSDGDLRLELRSVDGTTIYIVSDALTSVHTFEADTEVKPRIVVRLANINFETGIEYQYQLEVESTATAYEPYTAQEYNIALPTAAGTVYGGSLTVNDDGSGTLTVDRAIIASGDASSYARNNATAYYMKRSALPGVSTPAVSEATVISDRFISRASATESGVCFLNNGNIQFNTASEYATVAEMLAGIGTPQFVYPLAEPQTYTLTASQVTTLLGDNTVWMDADGSIDLAYRADTQMYIDNRFALLNANLAFIEGGMTASRAYSAKQYVTIDGKLYKVASAIAKDAAFTIGTNVIETTVGNELTALN